MTEENYNAYLDFMNDRDKEYKADKSSSVFVLMTNPINGKISVDFGYIGEEDIIRTAFSSLFHDKDMVTKPILRAATEFFLDYIDEDDVNEIVTKEYMEAEKANAKKKNKQKPVAVSPDDIVAMAKEEISNKSDINSLKHFVILSYGSTGNYMLDTEKMEVYYENVYGNIESSVVVPFPASIVEINNIVTKLKKKHG